jgi:NAD(P)-dependent dehydrogenase (short-subunit alcohol dehydrogenase family)
VTQAGLLAGKAALVTGGASGIGRATALAFAREGARVLVADTAVAEGEQVARAIREAGGEASFSRTDVTREADVAALVLRAVDEFGRLDCAVNNAGVTGGGGAIQDLALEVWSRTLAINLTAVFLCMKHELAVMRAQKSGAIVNMSSGAGVIAVPGLAAYCASKHGVLGLTKTAAVENARSGVRVNAILPGSTDTPMLQAAMASDPKLRKLIESSSPAGRLGLPEEIAEAAVWLCCDRASFVSGESMLVDGGSVAR